jgi:3-phosphoglycerate kinase
MNKIFTTKDFDIKDKRVLVRVDFNVPLDDKGNITDDKRIKAALPTIKYLIKNKAMVILMSHLGRPKGKIINNLKMDKIVHRLQKLLKKKVYKLDDCIGQDVEDFIDKMVTGEVVLLENLRFYKEEKDNDLEFAQSLSDLGDYYVNDAFGTCHRVHASVEGITKYMPSAAGFLVQKEIEVMGNALAKPKKPFVAIMGGVKVSDKINAINNLLKKVNYLLIGGAMMFTFLKSKGVNIGKSLVEDNKLGLAKSLLRKGKGKLILPIDTVAAAKIDKKAKSRVVDVNEIPKDMIGVDIGPKTIKLYKEKIRKAKTIVWNGSLGVNEINKFAKGTNETAKAMAKSRAVTIVGGGDTAAAVDKLRLEKKLTHVSTGGGASLEFLEGKKLSAIAALEKNYRKFK